MTYLKQISLVLLLLLCVHYSIAQNLPIFQYKKRASAVIDTSKNLSATDKQSLDAFYKTLNGRYKAVSKNETVRVAMADSLDSVRDKIRFADYIPLVDSNRRDLLRKLRDSLRDHQTYNDTAINRIVDRIEAIKAFNTQNRLLARKRFPVPFFIGNIGQYNIDTLNAYLFNQTGLNAFQNVTLQNYLNSTVISGELANFNFSTIPLRMALVGSFSSTGDTAVDKAKEASIQKILTSGGSLSLNFSVPLFMVRNKNNCLHFGIYGFTSFGLSSGIDTAQSTLNFDNALFSSQIGGITHFDLATGEDNAARIEFNFPFYYVWGSEYTYQQLSQRDYCVLKLQAGVVLGSLVTLHISGPLLSSSSRIQRIPYVVSLQFSPSEAAKAAGL